MSISLVTLIKAKIENNTVGDTCTLFANKYRYGTHIISLQISTKIGVEAAAS